LFVFFIPLVFIIIDTVRFFLFYIACLTSKNHLSVLAENFQQLSVEYFFLLGQ